MSSGKIKTMFVIKLFSGRKQNEYQVGQTIKPIFYWTHFRILLEAFQFLIYKLKKRSTRSVEDSQAVGRRKSTTADLPHEDIENVDNVGMGRSRTMSLY